MNLLPVDYYMFSVFIVIGIALVVLMAWDRYDQRRGKK